MITSKQRSSLRAIANSLDTIIQIGKGGLTENVKGEINNALDARELIKITVLKNCEFSAKELINDLCRIVRCEPVQAVGGKIIVYRKSRKDGVKHIEF